MRKLIIAGALGALAIAISACGGSSGSAASDEALQRQLDVYAITQIERNFHESMAKKDIEEMMSLDHERHVHVRPRADGDREGADPADLAELEILRAFDALEC